MRKVYAHRIMYLWLVLVMVRLGWSLISQTGYIHPDEFFQSVEVVAGDALNVSVVRTWEFTPEFPLRSMVLPQALFYPVCKLLEYADHVKFLQLSGYSLVAGYRVLMAVVSLWIDYCVFRICCILDIPGHTGAFLLASSYVTLTFQIHTFSNSLETLLFSTLILFILEYMKADSELDKVRSLTTSGSESQKIYEEMKGESVLKDDAMDLDSSFDNLHKMAFSLRQRQRSKCQNSETEKSVSEEVSVREEGKTAHSELRSERHYMKEVYIILIAVVICVGMFNRPTFVLFALLPLIMWVDECFTANKPVLKPGLLFANAGLFTSLILSLVDTIYFRGITVSSLSRVSGWKHVFDNIVLTPFNFFMYNISPKNLESHGQHPFYLHMVVNMPMLYGPLLYPFVKKSCAKCLCCIRLLYTENSSQVRKTHTVKKNLQVTERIQARLKKSVLFLVLLPVIFLSFFPHQEARFLIPLLPAVIIGTLLLSECVSKHFLTFHIIFNLFFCVIFGVLHQGGVLPCLFHLQQRNLDRYVHDNNMPVRVIFSHTYMPPKHLLLTRSSDVELLDFKGTNIEIVCHTIENIALGQKGDRVGEDVNFHFERSHQKVFLALPGSVVNEFKFKCEKLHILTTLKFFPHLSLENPPDLRSVNNLNDLFDLMSLYLLEFE